MRIRISFILRIRISFILRIRIQLFTQMRIRIRNPSFNKYACGPLNKREGAYRKLFKISDAKKRIFFTQNATGGYWYTINPRNWLLLWFKSTYFLAPSEPPRKEIKSWREEGVYYPLPGIWKIHPICSRLFAPGVPLVVQPEQAGVRQPRRGGNYFFKANFNVLGLVSTNIWVQVKGRVASLSPHEQEIRTSTGTEIVIGRYR